MVGAVTNSASKSVAADLYKSAPIVTRTLQSLRPYICPFDELVRWVPPHGTVLDVGCGAGLFLGLIGRARPDVRGVGFDANKRAIDVAQGMSAKHFPAGRIEFRWSDVADPWPSGTFDVVSLVDVLHHITPRHQADVIAEAYAHVAPGGLLLYKDMARRPLFHAWWNRLHDIVLARQWIHYRDRREVEAWLEGAAAQIIHRGSQKMGPYAHEFLVVRKGPVASN
jgi:2-polyprenyl-3-methyl-5-hydroxy-6-metoxy-1,4-benzoquinol methylase